MRLIIYSILVSAIVCAIPYHSTAQTLNQTNISQTTQPVPTKKKNKTKKGKVAVNKPGGNNTVTPPKNDTNGGTNPTEDEISKGLKEALNVGINNATKLVSVANGYYGNPKIKIPFPPEVQQVQDALNGIGLSSVTDNLVQTLNSAAEEAAKTAAPIFLDAIKQLTLTDVVGLFKGGDNAATNYLKSKTLQPLKTQYAPIVKTALNKVKMAQAWDAVAGEYNKIPFVDKVNPNLEDYTTQKALDGLFYMLGQEEAKIRKDPSSQITDLLKKIFGNKK